MSKITKINAKFIVKTHISDLGQNTAPNANLSPIHRSTVPPRCTAPPQAAHHGSSIVFDDTMQRISAHVQPESHTRTSYAYDRQANFGFCDIGRIIVKFGLYYWLVEWDIYDSSASMYCIVMQEHGKTMVGCLWFHHLPIRSGRSRPAPVCLRLGVTSIDTALDIKELKYRRLLIRHWLLLIRYFI